MGFFSKLFKKKDNKKEKKPELNKNEREIEQEAKPTAAQANAVTQPKPKAPASVPKAEDAPAKTKSSKPKEDLPKAKPQAPSDTIAPQKPEPEAVKADAQPEPQKSGNSGFFEIKKSKDDRYVFNLFASNRVIVATSQIYSSPQSALNGINSVIANAESANIEDQTVKDFVPQNYPKWEIYKDKGGDFRFRLSASNGSCICHSQGYTSKANCKKGIESIIKNTKTAKIEKSYLKKQ